jgi:methylmalonyl-CoA mutase, N-terminal domain
MGKASSASAPSAERQRDCTTTSGIKLQRVYTAEDLEGFVPERDLGEPGEFPYTRGIHPSMYRGRLWTIRPITGFMGGAMSNARLKELVKVGQTGIHVVPDLPTYLGLDSDDPRARGEVGRGGVAFDTLADMEELLDGIPLDQVSVSFTSWGVILFAMLLALAEKQGVPPRSLRGTTQNDVILYRHSCNFIDLGLRTNLKLFADLVEYTTRHIPAWYPVSISGYNTREAGCSAAEEIAFAFGDAIEYIDAVLERGFSVDEFVPRFTFMLNSHRNFFEEIAKMRAMRRMWARLMKERYGAKDPRTLQFRFHTQTSGFLLTAQQPLNNVVRATLHGLAAVLGGTQSMHLSCYDEACCLPTDESIRLSVNTQNILAYESGVAEVVDPLGGSYYVEALTNELERKAAEIMQEVEAQGGMVTATLNGWVQKRRAEYTRAVQQKVDSGEHVIVGVNAFAREDEPPMEAIFAIPPSFESEKVARLGRIKQSRNQAALKEALAGLEKTCRAGANTVEATLAAVKAYATWGEIYGIYRRVWGDTPREEILLGMSA